MIKKYMIGTAFCLMLAPVSMAQKSYTLEECKQLAQENNYAIRSANYSINMAEEQKKDAFTNYFPSLSASGMGFASNKDFINVDMQGMPIQMVKNGYLATVSAVQPVYAGGKIINSNKLSQVGIEAGKLQKQQMEKEVNLTTEQYFWQIIRLQEKLKTVEAVQSMLDKLEKDVTVAVNAGITNRNDLLQVQLRSNEVLSSRITILNNISVSRMLLTQYLGLADSTYVLQSDMKEDSLPVFPLGLRQDHQSALRMIPEYHLLEKNVESQTLQRKLQIGNYLPTVGVGAMYGNMKINQIDRLSNVTGFVQISIPISGWWGGSHAVRRSKIAEINAREQLTDQSEKLVIRMEKTWKDVEDSYQQLCIADKSIRQSSENLRLNRQYYSAGTTTMSDLLEAQSSYQQSRDKYVDAYAEYQTKILEYRQVTGLE